MIAVILAAGKGSRLGNHTTDLPKSLLKLNDTQTLLDYNLEVLNKLGVQTIFVVTGFNSEKIKAHVKDKKNIRCIFNPFWNHCNVLGSLYMAFPYLNDDVLFLHADTIVGYKAWETLITHKGDIVLPYKEKVCGEEEMKVKFDLDGNLIEVNKTMPPSEARGEFLGIAKFSSDILNYLKIEAEKLFATNKLDFYMEAVVQEAIFAHKDVQAFSIGNIPFIEVDFEEDYLHLKEMVNEDFKI